MEVQSNNDEQETDNTPELVNVKVTVDKPIEPVDTDNRNVEYVSVRTQHCQIEVKVAHSSESSDNPAGSEEQSLDDEMNSKNICKLNKNSEQDFDTFEKYWKIFTCSQVVHEQERDLFGMPNEYSLAHCVAEDFDLRHGIVASSFLSQFKNLGYLCSQNQKQGGVAYLKDQERYVYYLVTKRVSWGWGNPTYQTMWNSLYHLRLRMQEHGVRKLAVPKLVCGCDQLEWVKVKVMIETIFKGMEDVEIVICNFQQKKQINWKCRLTYWHGKLLAEMAKDTILIYLGCEDNTETDMMKSIDQKHPFLDSSYRTTERKIGKAVVTNLEECTLTGFIVRKCKNDPVDFVAFETCAQQLNRENQKRKTPYCYAVMEDFQDPQDELMTHKFVNILIFVLVDVHVAICKT